MRLIFTYIKSKRKSIFFFLIFMSLLGIISLVENKKDNIPYQKYHKFLIEVYYEEGSVEIIESLLTSRIVDVLVSLDFVKNVYSTSKFGKSEVIFESNESELSTIQEKIERLYDKFPKEVSHPIINSIENIDSSILKIAIFSNNQKEIEEITKKILKIEGVKNISGKESSEIETIEYDTKKLELIGISNRAFISYFNNEAKKSYIGNLRDESNEKGVMSRGIYMEAPDNLNSIPFYVPLTSFAEKKTKTNNELSFYNGKECKIISIYIYENENIIPIIDKIVNLFEVNNKGYIEVIYNKKEEIRRINLEFVYSLLITISICIFYYYNIFTNSKFVIILLLLSFISIIFSFLLLFLYDKSINQYSLTGISLSIGMLFDNSNTILSLLLTDTKNRVSDFYGKIVLSLRSSFFSLFTSIIVFLPIFYLKSRIAFILQEICFSFLIVLLTNYVISYLVIIIFLEEADIHSNKKKENKYIYEYINIFSKYPIFKKNKSKISIFFLLFLLISSLVSFYIEPKSIYPKIKTRGVSIYLMVNQDQTHLLYSILNEFDLYLSNRKEIIRRIRFDSKEQSNWTLEFSKPLSEKEVSELLNSFACGICKISYQYQDSISKETFSLNNKSEVLVFGEINKSRLDSYLKKNLEYINNYKFNLAEDIRQFSPNLEKISMTIQKYGKFKDIFSNPQKIYFSILDSSTNKENSILLERKKENYIDSNILDFYKSKEREMQEIYTRGGNPYLSIQFDFKDEKQLLKGLKREFPLNSFEFREERETKSIIYELLFMLLFSITLLYIFIYLIYESIYFCMVILSSLLFVILTSLLGIYLLSDTFSVVSFLGIILLSGLSVDSIVLFLEKIDSNKPLTWREISITKKKLKPIVYNNIFTTIFGLFSIIIVSGLYQFTSGIVVPILGGLLGLYIYYKYIFPIYLYKIFTRNK